MGHNTKQLKVALLYKSSDKTLGGRLASGGKLADGAHKQVLYLLPKKNREL